MKAKELRIGNWVYYLGRAQKITAIQINGEGFGYFSGRISGAVTQNQIQPIPLTEEIILRCDFGEVGIYDNMRIIELCAV